MSSSDKHSIVYVTSNNNKVEENRVLAAKCKLPSGEPVCSLFDFEIRQVEVKEVLEVDLCVMVTAEVVKAYSEIKVPCFVEHAGLIFTDLCEKSYPGGLTKPMWNSLGDRFIDETHSAGRSAIARAVVAYCDGMSIRTFVGETKGTIANSPCGSRSFYWDTIFIPDEADGVAKGLTYAQISDHCDLGLEHKVCYLSQSTKALLKFLSHLKTVGKPKLWAGR